MAGLPICEDRSELSDINFGNHYILPCLSPGMAGSVKLFETVSRHVGINLSG